MPQMRTRAYDTSRNLMSRLESFKLKNDYPLMRGIVVANNDPLMIGRIKVRIHCLHGVKDKGMKDEDLPWAYPCFFNASYDSGSFIVPEVNNTVWLMFEDGDVNKPVYIGGVYGRGVTAQKAVGNTDDTDVRYQTLGKSEIPSEVGTVNDKVVYKSPKGASIIVREGKGWESIVIEDQLGQSITLSSPFKRDANISRLENMDKFSLLDGEAEIEIRTINDSVVSIKSTESETSMDVNLVGSEPVSFGVSTAEKGSLYLARGDVEIDLKDSLKVKVGNEQAEFGDGEIKLKAPVVKIDAEDIYLGGE